MPHKTRISLVVLLLAPALAGCLGGDSDGDTSDAKDDVESIGPGRRDPRVPADSAAPRVVVALIDSGINVYHDAFQRDGGLPDDVVDSFVNTVDGHAPLRFGLTTDGEYEARFGADEPRWTNLSRETLYYFEGTNVLGISFAQGGVAVLDAPSSHGTATSGAVLAANPEAIVVMVEGDYADAEAWAAMQPWIDVVSMSYGPPGSVPGSGELVFGLTTHQATRLMWANGKIPVGAADNTPAPAPNDETAGPPWVVGVGGDHEEEVCREHISGNFPDVTSDFTQTLPAADDVSENRTTSGTSFSTPRTAGTYSKAVLETRRALNHTGGILEGALAVGPDGQPITNAHVRDAMNRTAFYFDFDACDPDSTSLPVNPLAPWLQMGWGHVDPSVVPAAVDHLLGVAQAADKPMPAQVHMGALHDYRTALWENI